MARRNLSLKLKRLKLERFLNFFFQVPIEIKIQHIFKSKYKMVKLRLLNTYIQNRCEFSRLRVFPQLKETLNSLLIGCFFLKSGLVANIISKLMHEIPYRILKKQIFNLKKLLRIILRFLHGIITIRVELVGKFRGKAKRTNLIHFQEGSILPTSTINLQQVDYSMDYTKTVVGIFGIKV